MVSKSIEYPEKFERIVTQTPFSLLPEREKAFLRQKAFAFQFTQQELRRISEMALDRVRWKETPLSGICFEQKSAIDRIAAKKRYLTAMEKLHADIKNAPKNYRNIRIDDKPKTSKPALKLKPRAELGLGRCPVASERTRCCNLLTLDAVEKCGFDCSYCSIQSFYHGNEVVFDSRFTEKLKALKLDPRETYHIGTGQSSDSLMWGNHHGVLEALYEFAKTHPNVILELKTKSRNIGWLLENPPPGNVVCTWSLNPQTIIDHEEHLSASLRQRIEAARLIADKGGIVGFHFHPIIHYHGWDSEYRAIADILVQKFDPRQVAMVSMGTLTFTKSVMNTIRKRDLTTKILQMPLESCEGKFSYPADVKLELFRHIYKSLSPWHDKVFFYLCMEPPSLWRPIFGFDYATNAEFESAMKSAYFKKIQKNNEQYTTHGNRPSAQFGS